MKFIAETVQQLNTETETDTIKILTTYHSFRWFTLSENYAILVLSFC